MKIIPSILVQTETEFIQELNSVQDILDIVQLDIADGKFVSNTTWADPKVVEKYSNIDIELHLMVSDPLNELKRWSSTEQIRRVLIHFEAVNDFRSTVYEAKQYGCQVGAVLNPDTDLGDIEPYLSELDAVMFMGVYPGMQGQKLIPEVLQKIQLFISTNPTIFTSIDGAVNEETLPEIIKTGVEAICPGSAIFKNNRTAKENIERMQNIINKLT